MKKVLKIALIVVLSIVVLCVAVGLIAYFVTGNAAKATEYKMGDDVVSSITAIVGERKAVGVGISLKNGVLEKRVGYVSDTVQEDIIAYTQYLINEGGFTPIELSKVPGIAQLAKQSVDESEILVMTIQYTLNSYTVYLQKGEGTLTTN